MELHQFVEDFASALAEIDRSGARHKHFQPGIGPFGEADAVRAALQILKQKFPEKYWEASTKRIPDLLIPGAWALEFKIIRPFGDNGKAAEHWSENVLHPYSGNTSSLGDCLKLLKSAPGIRKAVVIFGYEHSPPQISLDTAMEAFQVIASNVLSLRLAPMLHVRREGLVHPVHQVLRVFAFEVLGVKGLLR